MEQEWLSQFIHYTCILYRATQNDGGKIATVMEVHHSSNLLKAFAITAILGTALNPHHNSTNKRFSQPTMMLSQLTVAEEKEFWQCKEAKFHERLTWS
jgi:pyridoxine/pyridoxamine 5'-phosphate oxidase